MRLKQGRNADTVGTALAGGPLHLVRKTFDAVTPCPSACHRLAVASLDLLAALLLASCGGGGRTTDDPLPSTVSGVTVTASRAAINAGATTTLTATVGASSSCAAGVT